MTKNQATVEIDSHATQEEVRNHAQLEGDEQAVKEPSKDPAQYMKELKQIAESIPGPNEGRIQELKQMIRAGKLITKEALRETSEKLAWKFLIRKDNVI